MVVKPERHELPKSTDLQNVIFFTPSKFKAQQFYHKKCVIFGKTKFATKLRKQRNTKK